MPAHSSQSSTHPTATAPDGIAIHIFDLPAAAHAGIVEGRIPPGRYGVHRHLSLEQYSYVVAGEVTAITGNDEHPEGRATALAPGDLLLTLPGETLQFVNEGAEMARVLFICAPPYPPDDADTRMPAAHGPMTRGEVEAAIVRMETVRTAFDRIMDARITALRNLMPSL